MAIKFTATSGPKLTFDTTAQSGNAFSYFAWVRTGSANLEDFFACKGPTGGIRFYWLSASTKYFFVCSKSGESSFITTTASGLPVDGEWHSVGVSTDGNFLNFANTYLDGVHNRNTSAPSATVGRVFSWADLAANTYFGGGSTGDTDAGTYIIPGNQDQCYSTMWNTFLTQNEHTALASGINPLLIRPESIIYHWPFNQGTDAEIIAGASRLANTATIQSSNGTYVSQSYTTTIHYGDTQQAEILSTSANGTILESSMVGAKLYIKLPKGKTWLP